MRADTPREVNPLPPVVPALAPWPVSWSGIWIGALTGLAVSLLIGLAAIALGANTLGPGHQIVSWHQFGLGALIFGVLGSFFAFVAAGWVTAKIAGTRDPEVGMLHGAIAWLVAMPVLVLLAALGAGGLFGAWYGGLAGSPVWATPTSVAADPQAATIARNTALGAITALLLGLVGSVLGGWLATGEPMRIERPRGMRDRATRSRAQHYPHRVS